MRSFDTNVVVRRAAVLALTALLAAACSPPQAAGVAFGSGFALAAAAVNRAANDDCWGSCRPGTVCDKASGLCVEPGTQRAAPRSAARSSPPNGPYPAGHEYEVPPLASSAPDAGCAAAPLDGDAGAPGCRPGASAP